jgi:NAD(P)-dependent dehydrogenase (short-subunit alcohol dehydrogenase family)
MTGRIAVITGAGSGIGRSVAISLAAKGYRLVLAGRRADALDKTAALAPGAPEPILCVPTDVSDEASVKGLFDAAVARFGRVDLLFNNAGLNGGRFHIEDMDLAAFRQVVDVNLTGSFLCMQAAFRVMKAQEPMGGRIINNGSISLEGRKYDIAVGQIDIGNAASAFSSSFASGVPQADGRLVPEPVMDASVVGDTIVYMDSLPAGAHAQFLTVMPVGMPFIGRG